MKKIIWLLSVVFIVFPEQVFAKKDKKSTSSSWSSYFDTTKLQSYLAENIFNRVGMSNTFFDPLSQEFQIKPLLSTEYFFYNTLPFPPSEYPETPAGGIK